MSNSRNTRSELFVCRRKLISLSGILDTQTERIGERAASMLWSEEDGRGLVWPWKINASWRCGAGLAGVRRAASDSWRRCDRSAKLAAVKSAARNRWTSERESSYCIIATLAATHYCMHDQPRVRNAVLFWRYEPVLRTGISDDWLTIFLLA